MIFEKRQAGGVIAGPRHRRHRLTLMSATTFYIIGAAYAVLCIGITWCGATRARAQQSPADQPSCVDGATRVVPSTLSFQPGGTSRTARITVADITARDVDCDALFAWSPTTARAPS